MKIGITERGDAGIDLSWQQKLKDIDGAVLITKNITDKFIDAVLAADKPIILHFTCTGFGGTILEPNVPTYQQQLNQLKKLIDMGFPADHCVLRIDPLLPCEEGMTKFWEVMKYFSTLLTGVDRIRISVLDEYKHVKERFKEHGLPCLYDGFQASDEQLKLVIKTLASFNANRSIFQRYEICAENRLWELTGEICGMNDNPFLFEVAGCISQKDLNIMGLPCEGTGINPQNRKGCHCLSCKTELLTRKQQCPHGCLYCYWKS